MPEAGGLCDWEHCRLPSTLKQAQTSQEAGSPLTRKMSPEVLQSRDREAPELVRREGGKLWYGRGGESVEQAPSLNT